MYLGADLSYINQLEDQGAVYLASGQAQDPYAILHAYGANLVRIRLWHSPEWTRYSNLEDVERSLRRATALGLSTMLDFHYSDTWADPAKQIIPKAWAEIEDLARLEQALYDYTLETLLHLHARGLMPAYVQVGNEINTEILMPGPHKGEAIRWQRNAALINAGLRAVREAGDRTDTTPIAMLHIAQPENLMAWFTAAEQAGVQGYQAIGMSYYPKWSEYSIAEMGAAIKAAAERFQTEVMLVEVAYPWTQALYRAEEHLLGNDSLLDDFPASPQGQRDFLIAVTQAVADNGGSGVLYWEPAWVSTPQHISIWENATFFDYENQVHAGIEFLSYPYTVGAIE